jgi:hypothetical protein
MGKGKSVRTGDTGCIVGIKDTYYSLACWIFSKNLDI